MMGPGEGEGRVSFETSSLLASHLTSIISHFARLRVPRHDHVQDSLRKLQDHPRV